MPKLPSLSIAAKLYTIFALLATATVALALLAVVNSRHQTGADRRLTNARSSARRTSSASTA